MLTCTTSHTSRLDECCCLPYCVHYIKGLDIPSVPQSLPLTSSAVPPVYLFPSSLTVPPIYHLSPFPSSTRSPLTYGGLLSFFLHSLTGIKPRSNPLLVFITLPAASSVKAFRHFHSPPALRHSDFHLG